MNRGPRLASWFAFVVLLLMSPAVRAPAQAPVSREYQIKAVFLFNFTQFVEWPEDAFSDASAPFIIGVLGDNPFGTFLEETIKREAMKGHSLEVQYYSSVEEIKDCHTLFISTDNKTELRRALEKVQSKPVLTVSDAPDFARAGGMIQFYNESGRIRLRVNISPVNNARLVISSKLLGLAEVIPAKN